MVLTFRHADSARYFLLFFFGEGVWLLSPGRRCLMRWCPCGFSTNVGVAIGVIKWCSLRVTSRRGWCFDWVVASMLLDKDYGYLSMTEDYQEKLVNCRKWWCRRIDVYEVCGELNPSSSLYLLFPSIWCLVPGF